MFVLKPTTADKSIVKGIFFLFAVGFFGWRTFTADEDAPAAETGRILSECGGDFGAGRLILYVLVRNSTPKMCERIVCP